MWYDHETLHTTFHTAKLRVRHSACQLGPSQLRPDVRREFKIKKKKEQS